MSDEVKDNMPDSQPVSAGGNDLDHEIDHLLSDVESLTDEILSGPPRSSENTPQKMAPVVTDSQPITPPVDDAGLSAQTPLIQDGDRVAVEEIVADVDHELDQMEKKVTQIAEKVPHASSTAGGSRSSRDGGDSATADVASEIPVDFSADSSSGDLTPAMFDGVLESAPPAAGLETPTPVETDASSETTKPPADVSQENSTPSADRPKQHSILMQRVRRLIPAPLESVLFTVGTGSTRAAIAVLDALDRPFRSLSPSIKDRIGYCAIGTFFMGILALTYVLLLH